MLVLFIGDFYIPERQVDLPLPFKKLLVPNKINSIYSTGNVSKSTLEYLATISNQVTTIRGRQDSNYREKHICELEGFKVGLNSVFIEDQLLKEQLARSMNVDILVTGGTHQFEAYERNGRFYINPGSCTGAFSLDNDEVIPSFVLMDVQQSRFTLYVYKLIDNQVRVEKIDHSK